MRPKVIFAPETDQEPVTVEEARRHCEADVYDDSDVDPPDDAMFEIWIGAAREYCEGYLGLSLATQTLEIALNEFPRRETNYAWCNGVTFRSDGRTPIALPFGPVRQVLFVAWGQDSGVGSEEGELTNEQFVLDTYKSPAQIVPMVSWPYVVNSTNGIRIRYLAGYGVDSEGGEALPKSIKAAILLMIGHLYANREASTEAALATLPLGVEALLKLHQVRAGFA